ncbi:MAG: hypothetical protein CMM25_06870 [Rhodospirillaceae bacterium]|nr:hypothetical protein [Rhodospirillaceae bacterium]
MLSSINSVSLHQVLVPYRKVISKFTTARDTLERIVSTLCLAPQLKADVYTGYDESIKLASSFGLRIEDSCPEETFSWNGNAIAGKAETALIFHEIAHWQIASPCRRKLPDFGLGPGPETGLKARAEAFCCVAQKDKEEEENLASLLGILWEEKLGGPAILAFCEQNWLELSERTSTPMHFVTVLDRLIELDLVDKYGQPIMPTGVR